MARFESWRGVAIASVLALGLLGCSDRGYVTPPPQATNATLNSRRADQHPRLSYNGRYLVFASDRRNQRHIFVYDQQRRQLLTLPGLNQPGTLHDQPDISADGRYIVYVSEQLGKPDIFIYDRQTLSATPITRDLLGEVRHPTISGDGRFVAFETNRSGQWDIEIYDRGAGVGRSLPQSPNNDDPPPAPDAAAE
ncbi:MAG: TolB family protein [Spirulinaceae cyanobacterium SM2_1_0]|nr:TolB family protein [Spirulinaceae cyanobacterium SM2_1_0]